MIQCRSTEDLTNYCPVPLGNGELSVMIDMEGAQRQRVYPGQMTPSIWWAGRRYGSRKGRVGELIPFGYLLQSQSAPAVWEQELDPERGMTRTRCEYPDGKRVETEAFTHLEHPVLALRKNASSPLTVEYVLAAPGESALAPDRMRWIASPIENGVEIRYEVDGDYRGAICFLCDRTARGEMAGNRFRLTVDAGTSCFYLLFADSIATDDITALLSEQKELIRKQGFSGLFESHCAAWERYWSESHVHLPNERHEAAYRTAQYHLRISSTPWSIPTGIFATHWNGKYFGFDEHFAFMALATSGHLSVARKIPAFRFAGLEKAISRAYKYCQEDNRLTGARYHWETDESGDDCAPPGFWLEHIFNMASIALSSWYDYIYSGDAGFLRDKGYPVIARCADFYRTQHLYEMGDGRLIVGRCTDLERLGAGRENAYMTTCGVIATFDAAAAAANVLAQDAQRAEEWTSLARRLRESLPREEGRYVPYPGCPQKSIAVFAGAFPYPAVGSNDPAQAAAIRDFAQNELQYGNMYPVGDTVCTWYAGWMGIAYARLGQLDKTRHYIDLAAGETNCFSEIFEISKPASHPWFTTAEGVYVQMVNESLLQSDTNGVRLLPHPCPDGKQAEYRLAAVGGIMVEASVREECVLRLAIEARYPYQGTVSLPDGTTFSVSLQAGERKCLI